MNYYSANIHLSILNYVAIEKLVILFFIFSWKRWMHQFTKESGKVVEDCKLRVVYVFPQSGSTLGEDGLKQSSDFSNVSSIIYPIFLL